MNVSAHIGHNSAAEDGAADLVAREGKLVDAANAWLKARPAINTETDAASASDFISQLKGYLKSVEGWRVERKRPLDDAAKEIQNRAAELKKRVDAAIGLLNPRLTAYLDGVRRAQEAARKKAKDDARLAREEAERKALEAAKATDVVTATVEAEEAQQRADEAAKDAERVANTKANVRGNFGTRAVSLRTTVRVTAIADFDKAIAFYRDAPQLADLLLALANRDLRGKQPFPADAFIVEEERKAV